MTRHLPCVDCGADVPQIRASARRLERCSLCQGVHHREENTLTAARQGARWALGRTRCGCGRDYLSVPTDHVCEFPTLLAVAPPRVRKSRRQLAEEDVREIRARLRSGEAVRGIAADYGVSRAAIYAVRSGRTYRGVT